MSAKRKAGIDYRSVELDGVRYVIVRQSVFDRLCERANVKANNEAAIPDPPGTAAEIDEVSLAEKLLRRRLAARLSQAELARRAGVRAETLNRIERGHTTPDFATIRKLVVAIDAAEVEAARETIS